MKVLHVYNHFYPCVGGIESHIYDLCKSLAKLGCKSDVLCLNTCAHSNEKLTAYEEHEGIHIYRIPYVNLGVYKFAPTVIKYIKNYDLLHVHGLGFFSDFLAITRPLHKKAIVLSTHGGIFHTSSNWIKKLYFYYWSRFVLKKNSRILAVSKNDERLFSKISNNVIFIPNAINVDQFNIERVPQTNTFIYVGRISKNKRLEDIIKTLSFLEGREIKFYIIGEDWEGIKKNLENLIAYYKLSGMVTFTDKVDRMNLLNYFSKAGFFISASEYEGFGIAALEAMAAGVPVILNDIEAFRNLVKDGENGFIVDFSNPEKASGQIIEILGKDLNEISKNAKRTASDYDLGLITHKIKEVYEAVI